MYYSLFYTFHSVGITESKHVEPLMLVHRRPQQQTQ